MDHSVSSMPHLDLDSLIRWAFPCSKKEVLMFFAGIFFGGTTIYLYMLIKNIDEKTLIEYDSEESYEDFEEEDEEYVEHKMVLVVNKGLKMDKGKVAAQCCHACLGAFRRAIKDAPHPLREWSFGGQAKVTLQCMDTDELLSLAAAAKDAGLVHYVVTDAGRTQIPAGSRTVLAIGPAPIDKIDKITGSLKLY